MNVTDNVSTEPQGSQVPSVSTPNTTDETPGKFIPDDIQRAFLKEIKFDPDTVITIEKFNTIIRQTPQWKKDTWQVKEIMFPARTKDENNSINDPTKPILDTLDTNEMLPSIYPVDAAFIEPFIEYSYDPNQLYTLYDLQQRYAHIIKNGPTPALVETLTKLQVRTKEELEEVLNKSPATGLEIKDQLEELQNRKKEQNALTQCMADMNKKYALITDPPNVGKMVIESKDTDGYRIVTVVPINDIRPVFLDENYTITENGRSQRVDKVTAWLKDPKKRARKVLGVDFRPSQRYIKNYINLWNGWSVKAIEGDCAAYLSHIYRVIANGNLEMYEYVLNWMAFLIQYPEQLPEVALAIRGKEGVGKGIFVQEFGKLFFPHFIQLTEPSHVVGKFNNMLAGKLLVFADEAIWAGDKEGKGVLKSRITEKHLQIEPKFVNPYRVNNYIHLILSSNEDWMVPVDVGDRRYCVMEASDMHKDDSAYFKNIAHCMNNGGREALLYFLQHRNLEGVDIHKFPNTEARSEQMLRGSPMTSWWVDFITGGEIPSEYDHDNGENWEQEAIQITVDQLFQSYTKYVHTQRLGRPETLRVFGKLLRKLVDVERVKSNLVTIKGVRNPQLYRWVYEIPKLPLCRKKLYAEFHIRIEEPV